MPLSILWESRRFSRIAFVALAGWAAGSGFAQQKSDFAGDYSGVLGPLHVKLHIVATPDGGIAANVDSPDQKMYALPCSEILINGQVLSFTVPNVRGEWTGVMSADRKSLSGVWKQGAPMALIFVRNGDSTPRPILLHRRPPRRPPV